MSKELDKPAQEMLERAEQLELETIDRLRQNMHRAAEIEADLLERAAKAGYDQVPQALRAVADSKSKSVDKLLALTGREPRGERPGGNFMDVLESMARKGYLRINVGMDVVDSTAEEEGSTST